MESTKPLTTPWLQAGEQSGDRLGRQKLHVWLVEDVKEHAELVSLAFDAHAEFELTVVGSLSGARALLARSSPDLMILDLVLPDGRGTDLLAGQKEDATFPIVVLTAHGDEPTAVEAMKKGALDYLVKSEATMRLMPRFAEHAIREWQHLVARKNAEKEREALLIRERAARLEAERARRVGDEFLAMLSHELRSPLNAILGWSELLRAKERSRQYIRQALDIIERNARSQAAIIDDLLDMSRIMAGRMQLNKQQVDLSRLIKITTESIRPEADARGIGLTLYFDFPSIAIPGDFNRLQQVIWNLLSNAIKFTPRGGKVDVSLRQLDSGALIEVRDTGVGIAPEFLPRLFDKFFQADTSTTRQHGGLGLGLAIVRKIVELHHGEVRASSPGLNQGAAFQVILPMEVHDFETADQQRTPAVKDQCGENEIVDFSGMRVLVVDDEQDARELVRFVLEECHAQVDEASTAQEALAIFEQRRPGVLVSDLAMPQEDGYDLIRKVRALPAERGGRVPALALTALTGAKERSLALEKGFQMLTTKPVEPRHLAAQVAFLAKQLEPPF